MFDHATIFFYDTTWLLYSIVFVDYQKSSNTQHYCSTSSIHHQTTLNFSQALKIPLLAKFGEKSVSVPFTQK